MIVALIALGGVVAVDGLPDSSHSASAENVLVQSKVPATDGNEAVTPRATEFSPGPTSSAGGRTVKPAAKPGSGHGPSDFEDDSGIPQPLPPVAGPADPPALTPPLPGLPVPAPPHHPPHHNPPSQPPADPPLPVPIPTHQGPAGGLVSQVEGTVHGLTGFSPGLPGTLSPITSTIDDTLGSLPGFGGGGLAAAPHLPSVPRP